MADFQTYNPVDDPVCTSGPPTINYTATQFSEPKSVALARRAPDAPQWAMDWNSELDSLEARGILTYVHKSALPPNTKLLPTTMVLKLKRDKNGTPLSRKARCTIRGDRQLPGIHYDPTQLSSPVAHRDAIRTSLALAAAHGYHVHHWDLESAFLHELFPDDIKIFVHQPKRFDGSKKHPGKIARLTGNMYGSKQACTIFTSGLANFLTPVSYTHLTLPTIA